MADRLVAWLYDTPVAVLMAGPEFRIRLEWHAEGIQRWGQLREINGRFHRLPPKDGSYRSTNWEPCLPVDLPDFLAELIASQVDTSLRQRCACGPARRRPARAAGRVRSRGKRSPADHVSPGILSGMTVTTIKVPKATRDRLHRLAKAEGITLAQAIDKLMNQSAPRPRPSIGGFRSEAPLDAEAIDAELARGFGA